MAQATVHNIGNPKTDPAAEIAEVAARTRKFASAFQGMEGDITDMMHMARLLGLCFEGYLSGDQIQTDEDGKKYFVIATDDIDVIQFAGFELCDRIKSIHETYHNVFKII